MGETFRTLSWGCGVQSTTLGAMSALGVLPRLDAIIFSDTQWERGGTYETFEFYSDWFRSHGIPVYMVTGGNIREEGAEAHIHIPFWTSDGGPLRRECTRHFKIDPSKRRLRELIGFDARKPPHPKPGTIEQWLGFSLDEWHRMRDSRVKFIVNRFPLVENRLTRWDCAQFLEDHSLPVPIKSACIGCPFRKAGSWHGMKSDDRNEFEDAVDFDEINRHNPLAERAGSTADELFIYKFGGPLKNADLQADMKRERNVKQLPLMICEAGCWT